MATIRLPHDFKEFLQLLNSEGVKYLLVGGYAVAYYGYARATGDMDVWVAPEPRNAAKILEVLRRFGFGEAVASPDLFLKEDQVVRMGVPPMRIELLTTISGVRFAASYARRVVDTVDGVPVNLISLNHLKKNKKASGRTKDLNDLENLP
jgi:hypothetical protein